MKKQITFILILLLSISINAQKADITLEKVTLEFERPDYLKSLKTFSYQIQDDGLYWDYKPNPEHYPVDTYPDLASLTEGLTIKGMTQVKDNADLKVIVGFIGNQLKTEGGMIKMNGTISLMLVTKDNKLLTSYIKNEIFKIIVSPTKYPMSNSTERNQTKAKMLTNYVQKYLDKKSYLFSDIIDTMLPFGLFKKAKKGKALSFNQEATPLIKAIIKDASNIETLNKAFTYFESQLNEDFGKKVKDKNKNKVLYSSLASIAILQNNTESAEKYLALAKENTGFFDVWTVNLKKLLEIKKTLNKMEDEEFSTVKMADDMTYVITINEEGTFNYKKKQIPFTKITIARFVPNINSNIGSLDATKGPKIKIYKDDKVTHHYSGGKNTIIKTKSGKKIVFELKKKEYKPVFK